jgi:magnesium-transporting ATPase (P-type)
MNDLQNVNNSELVKAMATCHSLTFIQDELVGDPLDLKMFQSTKWELSEPSADDEKNSWAHTIVRSPSSDSNYNPNITHNELGIIKQFPFSSLLQRMSVIVRTRTDSNSFTLYCKGSPEKIAEMCKPETLPAKFSSELNIFTKKGYRVIAVATRLISVSSDQLRNLNRCQYIQISLINYMRLRIVYY